MSATLAQQAQLLVNPTFIQQVQGRGDRDAVRHQDRAGGFVRRLRFVHALCSAFPFVSKELWQLHWRFLKKPPVNTPDLKSSPYT